MQNFKNVAISNFSDFLSESYAKKNTRTYQLFVFICAHEGIVEKEILETLHDRDRTSGVSAVDAIRSLLEHNYISRKKEKYNGRMVWHYYIAKDIDNIYPGLTTVLEKHPSEEIIDTYIKQLKVINDKNIINVDPVEFIKSYRGQITAKDTGVI